MRRVIGYEGEGRARRPIYADEGPGAAGGTDGLAAIGRLSALDEDRPTVEAAIERAAIRESSTRKTSAEWGRESINPSGRTALSPLITVADPPVAEPEEEEPSMAAAETTELEEALGRINSASLEAIEALTDVRVANRRWAAAQTELEAACRAAGLTARPSLVEAADPEPAPAAPKPKRHRPGGDKERPESVEDRAKRVVEVLERHGGNTKAAGDELGMRGNVVAKIASSARRREAAAS